ncbi:hypothetical protein POM88_042891 [Heracleum sosnowskyi]|uniref:MORF/ORRM1/DAG-like MORF domain-containing protein n=1 Tax=Heracleum sosnowskyi TaxID=360622 RepID=A0AAD8HJQ3_9APIA|nr:hypothetical protein POM88_042891 [Heracleum sosnowskyi]
MANLKAMISEEHAKKKLYYVSTQCFYAFGALLSEELSSKIKEFPNIVPVAPDFYLDNDNKDYEGFSAKFKEYPNVVEVLPDCYVNSYEKDYGGEPFIDGKAVPYDPKYGIGIDSDDDTEEISDTNAEIPHTDVAAIADEVPHTAAAAIAADDEIPDTGAA